MRVGVVDIGTNSTRLLVADVSDGAISELDRRSIVTRLGEGVDATGRLGDEPVRRVLATLDQYRQALDDHGCEVNTGVLTSAVRDAANGGELLATVRDRYGIDARTIDGDTEARLTFLGATAQRSDGMADPVLVIDIGGGSTELVIGARDEVSFHVSTQAGVVRQSERHLRSDPPAPAELSALAADVRSVLQAAVPEPVLGQPAFAVAVAGTATASAAIDLQLDPYDRARVEGHRLPAGQLELLLARLAAMPLAQRREVVGLHPDRAPTIVAGLIILLETLRLFGLDEVTVSERDILWGAALQQAGVIA